LLSLPAETIQTFEELELKFLEKYFPLSKYWEKKQEISNFKQGESESLYDAWERFNLLLKRCPNHEYTEKKQEISNFNHGILVLICWFSCSVFTTLLDCVKILS